MTGLSTPVRLRLAALLCLVPLGMVWSTRAGLFTIGTTIYGDCDGSYCTPDLYLPGPYLPGGYQLGAQAPARVFLVAAAVAFLLVAGRTRTPATKRVARAATGAVGIALVLAVAAHAVAAVICLAAASALVLPLVGPRNPGVFVPEQLRR